MPKHALEASIHAPPTASALTKFSDYIVIVVSIANTLKCCYHLQHEGAVIVKATLNFKRNQFCRNRHLAIAHAA